MTSNIGRPHTSSDYNRKWYPSVDPQCCPFTWGVWNGHYINSIIWTVFVEHPIHRILSIGQYSMNSMYNDLNTNCTIQAIVSSGYYPVDLSHLREFSNLRTPCHLQAVRHCVTLLALIRKLRLSNFENCSSSTACSSVSFPVSSPACSLACSPASPAAKRTTRKSCQLNGV